MLRMIARRHAQRTLAAAADEVIMGMSLPGGTVVHGINGNIGVSDNTLLAQNNFVAYGCEGWVLPVLDPDAGSSLQTLFDQLVPKDTDVETMDLDTAAADASPFYEPGEIDWSALLDVGLKPKRIYRRLRVFGAADPAAFWTQNSSNVVQWAPRESFSIKVRKTFRVMQPSVLVFAVASPAGDDTTAVEEVALAEANWGQVKYAGDMLRRALLHVFGVVEAGAETPWEEATALLKTHLDPDVFEENATSFIGTAWKVLGQMRVDHSVVGDLELGTVTTGR